MREGRLSEEQIIFVPGEHRAGMPIAELCRKHETSDATFYTWRSKHGGLKVPEATHMKALKG